MEKQMSSTVYECIIKNLLVYLYKIPKVLAKQNTVEEEFAMVNLKDI